MRPNILVSVGGLPKSGKNYLAFTFPDPMVVYCFNGGAEFVRGKYFADKKIDIVNFTLPIIESTDMIWAAPVWQEFYQGYKKAAMSEKYQTLVLDTGTEIENICQQAVLEDAMDVAAEKGREKEKLATTEYLARNLKMKALFDLARNEGLNLVILNYLREKWVREKGEKTASNTGELVLDGWQRTETQADVNITMTTKTKMVIENKRQVEKTIMVATIKSCRFDRDLAGKMFEDTTYDELVALMFEE